MVDLRSFPMLVLQLYFNKLKLLSWNFFCSYHITNLVLHQVCYSWWVLSSLIIIDRVHWIDKEKLVRFILDCQVTLDFDDPFQQKNYFIS